jgi:hypothetical protein
MYIKLFVNDNAVCGIWNVICLFFLNQRVSTHRHEDRQQCHETEIYYGRK